MGAPHSGKFGVVDGQSTVKNWNIGETSTPMPYVASNTLCATGRLKGIEDWAGGFTQFQHTPLLMPGDNFTFTGYTAPDSDVKGGTGETFVGAAIIDGVTISWNWVTGEIISVDLTFSGNGALAQSTAVHSDVTVPDVDSTINTKITYGEEGAGAVEWENLTTAVLNITAANQTFVNSTTGPFINRKPGVIDWNLAVTQEDVDRGAQTFDKGDSVEFNLFVDATDFWRLKFGIVKDFTNITVDIETGAIIAQTVSIEMDGFNPSSGVIFFPGGAQWWPF